MYLVLNSEISIGGIKLKGIHECTIKGSIHEYAKTCVIEIPASAKLRRGGEPKTESVQTAKQFKTDDPVIVKLGYNGTLREEFRGFVTRVNNTSPVQIECEGYSWLLRKKKNIKKSWATTNLKEVLQEVVSGTGIKLHSKIPAIPLRNLVINNASGTQVLDYLKDLLKGTITAFFIDDTLYVGLTYVDVAEQTVKYKSGVNVISDDALKKHEKEDVDVKVEFRNKAADGTEKKTDVSSLKGSGIVRREVVNAVNSQEWLDKMAKAKLEQETFDGYEGEITAFLVPYCQAGWRAEYTCDRYPERSGNYFIEGVTVTFGQGGGRRIPEFGLKLS